MGFFSFLRRRLSKNLAVPGVEPDEYVPSFWDDDYCQIEIVPAPTFSMELRTEYFEATLTSFGLQRARRIRFDGEKILNCETGDTRAFGFANFTIFFDRQDEFVKNIWIGNGPGLSAPQLDGILATLYALGEECALVLADWNLSAFVDLADRRQTKKYLTSLQR